MFSRLARCSTRPQCLRKTALSAPLHPLSMPALPLTPRRNIYDNLRRSFRNEVLHSGSTRTRTLAALAILFAGSGVAVALWGYHTYTDFLSKTMHNYPPPVAKELRKGLYYGLYNKPQDAVHHFRTALQKCAELGMDPLSDEVTGIKIELAGILEKAGRKDKTIEILEHVLDEVVAGAKLRDIGVDRTRLLRRAVRVGLKLGELYIDGGKPAEAEEALVWAVETVLKERSRRLEAAATVGGSVDEGEWVSGEEVGMALENLADYYEGCDQHFLATPLYLQALDLLPSNNCHTVVLMNNLSISLAQQPIPPGAPITRQQLISDSATKWAQKALKLSETIKPPERTEECDTGCVVATYNLAEFAEMLNDRDLARQKFSEALSLAKGLGMKEGIERAEEGLKRLQGK